MINGAFAVITFDGKYLFIKRKDKALWDLPGGGFDPSEVDFTKVTCREIKEEVGLDVSDEHLHLYAVLGQRLKKEVRERYQVEKGLLFLHYCILHNEPTILLGDEHTEHRFFSYTEILERWKEFSSGPLWEFFAYLKYQELGKIQKGELFAFSVWQDVGYHHQ